MDKLSSTFCGRRFGLEIKGYRIIGDLRTENKFYEHSDIEVVRIVKGKQVIINSQDILVEKLETGDGVVYLGYFMFLSGSKCQKEFDVKFNKVLGEYNEFLNGKVAEFILDIHNFSIIKFTLSMFICNVYSEKVVKEKLKKYIDKDGVDIIFNQFLLEKTLVDEKSKVEELSSKEA